MKSEALAALIRKGLQAPRVIEDCNAFGVELTAKGPTANVIGLAYIGTGREPAYAAGMFEMAKQELDGGPDLTIVRIDHELGEPGADVTESLVAAHFQMTASAIADKLEAGTFEVD
jgi:hypothetical protein